MMVGLTLMKVSSCSTSVSVPNTSTMTAVTIAMMKAPVATNRLNLAFATKNTSSGPSSVASLNIGCGWVLSIGLSIKPVFAAILRDGASRLLRMRTSRMSPHPEERAPARVSKDELLDTCDRVGKIPRGERREILDAFADADEVHRQFEFLRQRHQDAAARGAVELRHHEAGDASGTMKCLDLRQCILSHRGVEHQQHGVRRGRIDLLDDANHLFELFHQLGLVLQAASGIDQQHVDILFLRRGQRVEGEARRIRTLRA